MDWDATTVISSLRVMAQPLGIEEPSMDIPNPCQQYSGCCFAENDCPGGMPVDWDATNVISSLRVLVQPLGIEEPSIDIPNACQQYSGCCFAWKNTEGLCFCIGIPPTVTQPLEVPPTKLEDEKTTINRATLCLGLLHGLCGESTVLCCAWARSWAYVSSQPCYTVLGPFALFCRAYVSSEP